MIKSVVGFTGDFHWDTTKPDGTLKKLMDVTILKNMNYTPGYSLHYGIKSVYHHYVQTQNSER